MRYILVGQNIYNLYNIAIIQGHFSEQGAEITLHFIHTIDEDKPMTTLKGSEAREFIDGLNSAPGVVDKRISIDDFCKK